jgi:hypothetical protein
MILLNEVPARTAHAATTKHVTCPDCAGTGEIESNVTRNEWGAWDCDSKPCTWCAGTGQVELTRCQGVECEVWFDLRDQMCVHGEPLCDAHRHECEQCTAEARAS